jgi:hypothetical protein
MMRKVLSDAGVSVSQGYMMKQMFMWLGEHPN